MPAADMQMITALPPERFQHFGRQREPEAVALPPEFSYPHICGMYILYNLYPPTTTDFCTPVDNKRLQKCLHLLPYSL